MNRKWLFNGTEATFNIGNMSKEAITFFAVEHTCNKFCDMAALPKLTFVPSPMHTADDNDYEVASSEN
uniref:Alpha-type protein kinase domain-containing protein n=1 Tax=Strigamia maritima TaxID=126957 RepID=T1J2W2_STRMM